MDQIDIDFDNWLHDHAPDGPNGEHIYAGTSDEVRMTGARIRELMRDAYIAGES